MEALGEVVVRDEVGRGVFHDDVEFPEVVEREAVVFANAEDAIDVFVADAGDAEEGFARCGVDVDGEELGVGLRAQADLGSSVRERSGLASEVSSEASKP